MSAGLTDARLAAEQYDWDTALRVFCELDAAEGLGADDLERYAEAAVWMGDFEAAVSVTERAFKAYVAADDCRAAARMAIDLCVAHAVRESAAVASGWGDRALQLLEGEPPCPEWARLLNLGGMRALLVDHDPDAAVGFFKQAVAMARDVGDRSAEMLAQGRLAGALAVTGDVARGVRLLDAAMTAAISGELDPMTTANIYCLTISTSQSLGDIRRAREWSDEAIRCSQRPGMADFPGDCRPHRAELIRIHGDWDRAEVEVERAIPELEGWDRHHAGNGWYELGEIAIRRGDLNRAADAYSRAVDLGHDGQPGLARLRMMQGDPSTAVTMLDAALAALGGGHPLRQAQLLPVLIEAHLASGRLVEAQDALGRLEDVAAPYGTVGLRGVVASARAVVAARGGDAESAVTEARKAVSTWREAEAPYETARAQVVHAEVCQRLGELALARLEAEAAAATFESLGAALDRSAADRLLAAMEDATTGDRAVFTFMFTDVVDSTKLVAAMGDTEWSNVIDWHDRTIRSLLTAHLGAEVKQRGGGDGFFAVFDDAFQAIGCALAVQAEFARHRGSSGFAPHVRIGVHRAEATHRDGDYFGLGVHAAARVAESAGADEVVVSVATLDGVDPGQVPNRRESRAMKGLPEPVEVVVFGGSAPADAGPGVGTVE